MNNKTSAYMSQAKKKWAQMKQCSISKQAKHKGNLNKAIINFSINILIKKTGIGT